MVITTISGARPRFVALPYPLTGLSIAVFLKESRVPEETVSFFTSTPSYLRYPSERHLHLRSKI